MADNSGSNNVMKMSPRQRMINLMYIVLTAMLALNVSSDVLNGFNRVHDGLKSSANSLEKRNMLQYGRLEEIHELNPVKAKDAYLKGQQLRARSAALNIVLDSLKLEIARKADGPKGNPDNLINREDLDAAAAVMLNPMTKQGEKLHKQVVDYTNLVTSLISDDEKQKEVKALLSTVLHSKSDGNSITWEQGMFENMPAVAALTLLTKLQTDLRQAEAEGLASLISSVDIGDIRVNELNAYVIPRSNMVMRGSPYSADIVLAAIDTTKRPEIYVGGNKLSGGHYEFTASGSGTQHINGFIEFTGADGNPSRREFSTSYTVIEPMATVSATLTNVLYAGIDNPISISVPGVDNGSVQATMTNGVITRKGEGWSARPAKIGENAVITVSANIDGRNIQTGSYTFRVRKLPDPTPYILVRDGNSTMQYKGTPKRLSKAALMSAEELGAAADDEIFNANYSVISFTTLFYDSMGNAIPEVSDGARFSARQKEQFRRLKAGKRFFITSVKAKGPDGIVRDISPMEVAIN